MKEKGKIIVAATGLIGFFALIALVRFADVAAIGPQGTGIGLSHLNGTVFRVTGVHMLWYTITDWLGVAALLTALFFAVFGLVQLIKRRSLFKVDKAILALGGLYLVVIGCYLLFETVVVNYRPVIMPGCTAPEASFPSSHTMLVCVIMGSAAMLARLYVKQTTLRRVLCAVCAAIISVTVVGRLIAGVHWFTDILGGVLISTALLSIFDLILGRFQHREGENNVEK